MTEKTEFDEDLKEYGRCQRGFNIHKKCQNPNYPCLKSTDGKCYDESSGEIIEGTCPAETIPKRNKCGHKWPTYPCYDPKTSTCKDSEGTQLFDPLADAAYMTNEMGHSICSLFRQLLTNKDIKSSPAAKQATLDILNSWGVTAASLLGGQLNLASCPNVITFADTARNYDAAYALGSDLGTKVAVSGIGSKLGPAASLLPTAMGMGAQKLEQARRQGQGGKRKKTQKNKKRKTKRRKDQKRKTRKRN